MGCPTARQTSEDANLPMMFKLLDLNLVDLDTRSQLKKHLRIDSSKISQHFANQS